jgi:hypothetical protein
MDGTGEHHVKQSEPGSKSQRLHVFPYMWKVDLQVICICKYTYDHNVHTHIHIYTHSEREQNYIIGSL